MKTQRILIVLTLVNMGILIVSLTRPRPVAADDVVPVLRGRSLEIVDEHGRVRASILIHAADPKVKLPNGKTLPDTTMLRLIDPKGRPEVKLGASEQGAGLGLAGETDSTYITLLADGPDSSLKMTNKAGREQMVKP